MATATVRWFFWPLGSGLLRAYYSAVVHHQRRAARRWGGSTPPQATLPGRGTPGIRPLGAGKVDNRVRW